ncbi:MAG: hypothetical protein GY909_05150 [Oligoflexia bacterium]|nr:hypothetical protein [Oligoflexia bacterium]
MSQTDLSNLPDYSNIRNFLDSERKTIIKVNGFSGEDESFVREIDDAKLVLTFLEEIQTEIRSFLKEYPSLSKSFTKEYIPFNEFVSRDNVIDLIFLDDCLFPEKEMYFFGQDGEVNENVLELSKKSIYEWVAKTKNDHEVTQKAIRENENTEMRLADYPCGCVACQGDYRGKLRELILAQCMKLVDDLYGDFEERLEKIEIDDAYYLFNQMQKGVEKSLYKQRARLKRSTINRLESQIKNSIKEKFTFPSELAKRQETKLVPYLKGLLYEEDIKDDIIGEEELKKFFNQIGQNIWRSEKYLAREFKKLTKSVMVLKRKDISGTILQEYIGEFWVHSQARTIKRKIIYHMGPTNSGKTYHAIEALSAAEKGCYLAPLRLLAAELYDTLNNKGCVTTLLTGEEVIEKEGATHYSSTIEMARLTEVFDCCVIDEIQMITDKQRGWAWTRALVNIFATEVHLCGDPSALELVKQIVELCGDELEIKNYERMTKLEVEEKPISISQLQKNDALIVFSRRNALRYKRDLERIGFKVSIVYGRLSPEVRREQARKFDEGETDIMVSTDAIAMGMNLPIKRVVFSTLSKHFNNQEHFITESEIKQIAGRAGRYKRFPTGYVTCLQKVEEGLDMVRSALSMKLDQSEKCMVGPDLDIFSQVNGALEGHGLDQLKLSEFLRLFNTMTFQQPFYCVELKEMIELAETVEDADVDGNLSNSEIFGFACAPVNLGLMEHVQYYVWILNHYVAAQAIPNEEIDHRSSDIDYLETSIKCVELYQWLSRHFNNKNFYYDEARLLDNKSLAIEKLNTLLSNKIVPTCSSCGCKLPENTKFNICEQCFHERKFRRGRKGYLSSNPSGKKTRKKSKSGGQGRSNSKKSSFKRPGSKKKAGGSSKFSGKYSTKRKRKKR